MLRPTTRALFQHRHWGCLRKCASRHNSVHFFNSSTSKSATTLRCFSILTWKCASRHNGVHFVRHLNFQRCFHAGVFFCILTWNCASHYNGVHFFNSSTSKSAPTLRWRFDLKMCFAPQRLAIVYLASPQMASHPALASLLFDPPGPQNIGKTQGFATFLPFRAPASSFFWLCLFSDPLSYPLLNLPISAFSSVHIVGSLTSKLPSIAYIHCMPIMHHDLTFPLY